VSAASTTSVADEIPAEDVSFSFLRSSGPGGQNVNKVATAVQLRFDLAGTRMLDDAAKARLRVLAGRRLTLEDAVLITARTQRSQEGNRREALERLADLIERARLAPKQRRATRPTRASQQRRLESKTRAQRTKRLRGKVSDD
jgi:ribosome-associated protein